MAKGISAGLTARSAAAQGRRFGLTVGSAFLVLAAVAYWRGRHSAATTLAGLGGALAIAGLVIPGRLRPVERAWMRMAHAISKVTTPIFMGAVYFLVIMPTGVLRRAVSRNPLVHDIGASGYWVTRDADKRRSDLNRQF